MFLRNVDMPKVCVECYGSNFSLVNKCNKAICPLLNYRRVIKRYRRVLGELKKEKQNVLNELCNIAKEMGQ